MSRRWVGVGFVAACLARGVVSCTDLGGLTGAADGPDGAGGDSGADGAVASTDAGSYATGSDGSRVDEASIEAGCCDCDGDGYRNNGCDASAWDGAAALDCDDLAPDIHPAAGFTTGSWPASPHTPAFDWNCDGVVTTELPSAFAGCGGALCSGEGFVADPGCSKSDAYFRCTKAAVCSTTSMSMTQGCK